MADDPLAPPSDPKAALIDAYKIVCLCNKIRKGIITKALLRGAKDLASINRRTGTGSGPCGGRRCGPMIREILGEEVTHCETCGWAIACDDGNRICPRCSYVE